MFGLLMRLAAARRPAPPPAAGDSPRATRRSPAHAAAARPRSRAVPPPRASRLLLLDVMDHEQPLSALRRETRLRRQLLQIRVLHDLRRHAGAGNDVADGVVRVVSDLV